MTQAEGLSAQESIKVWIEPVSTEGNPILGEASPYPLYQEGSPYYSFVVEDGSRPGFQKRSKGWWKGASAARAAARRAFKEFDRELVFVSERCSLEWVPSSETTAVVTPAEKGRLGGQRGGPARAQRLTRDQRKDIAARAAAARWGRTPAAPQPAAPEPSVEQLQRIADLSRLDALHGRLEELRRMECSAILRRDNAAEVAATLQINALLLELKTIIGEGFKRLEREGVTVDRPQLDRTLVVPYRAVDDAIDRGAHDPKPHPFQPEGLAH